MLLLLLVAGGFWLYQQSQRLQTEVQQANVAREAEARRQQELQAEIARAQSRNEELNQQLEQAQQCASKFPSKMAGCVLSFSMDDVLVSDWPLLHVGAEVFSYDYAQLREAKPLLMGWLGSEPAQSHALVLMSASKADQVKAVQTLLELLGVGR